MTTTASRFFGRDRSNDTRSSNDDSFTVVASSQESSVTMSATIENDVADGKSAELMDLNPDIHGCTERSTQDQDPNNESKEYHAVAGVDQNQHHYHKDRDVIVIDGSDDNQGYNNRDLQVGTSMRDPNEQVRNKYSHDSHADTDKGIMLDEGDSGVNSDIKCVDVKHQHAANRANEAEKVSLVDKPQMGKANPFEQFAFGVSSNTTEIQRGRKWIVPKHLHDAPKPKKAKTSGNKSDWKPMAELATEEQERVKRKWHGLVIHDSTVSVEDARFQIMVASRLHARCQEGMVRKCMAALHDAGVLTCIKMAQCDWEVLASLLTCLQYYNTKSKHLVQASKQLLENYEGKVPESKEDLLKIIGIGPVMADLLSTINTLTAHQSI